MEKAGEVWVSRQHIQCSYRMLRIWTLGSRRKFLSQAVIRQRAGIVKKRILLPGDKVKTFGPSRGSGPEFTQECGQGEEFCFFPLKGYRLEIWERPATVRDWGHRLRPTQGFGPQGGPGRETDRPTAASAASCREERRSRRKERPLSRRPRHGGRTRPGSSAARGVGKRSPSFPSGYPAGLGQSGSLQFQIAHLPVPAWDLPLLQAPG